MAIRHDNPTDYRRKQARAPYNFIPLPEQIVPAPDKLPGHNTYQEGTLTGWIDCEIETKAPTYIRGMMTEAIFKEQGLKKQDDPTPDDPPPDDVAMKEKKRRAPFFATGDGKVEGRLQPALPGSSIRGMIRQLVEVLGYGRIRWVADQPKMFFRAVAAPKNDPLRDPYNRLIGRFAKHVSAGYLLYDDQNDNWYVMPARKWPTGETYIKIKDTRIQQLGLPGYIPFDDSNYKPQVHQVSFEPETEQGRRGPYIKIKKLGPRGAHRVKGNLLCAGNMLETNDGRKSSPRARQTLILLPNTKQRPFPIPDHVVQDYRDSLTPFQQEELTDYSDGQGCLGHLNPVFYILDDKRSEVLAFGHSPNFRVPALVWDQELGRRRAATPYDFVPDEHKGRTPPDLADAIFGWVEEEDGPAGSRAGRVFFGDAHFTGATDGVWMKMITPHVLASPKPSTFQHYLVQDRQKGHDPNNKKKLAHYATPREETQIRGVKHYWHKGKNPDIRATADEKEKESQLTRMIPLKPGVRFTCRIHFENLRPEELGVLWWALALPAGNDRTYYHKLGMGKPLGMGGVAIHPTLHLTDRAKRYDGLFTGDAWQEAAQPAEADQYARTFEEYILQQHEIAPGAEHIAQLERIRMLLAMLEWKESDGNWLEQTRYMEIERGKSNKNEYKDRPVLSDPLHVT